MDSFMEDRVYRLGREYKDRGGIKFPEDQFLRWINLEGSGIGNSGGIRTLRYTSELVSHGLPAYLVLVTTGAPTVCTNPWEDIVDFSSAEISYWGDAKLHDTKRLDDFSGNGALRRIYDKSLEGERGLLPPILHFSRERAGYVRFNGLCVLKSLELSWFDQDGIPIRNYHAKLTILDCEEVRLDWLQHRVRSQSIPDLDNHPSCPKVWKSFRKGKTEAIDIWQSQIREKEQQLPAPGSAAESILVQLTDLASYQFEKVVVSLFREQQGVVHHISGTKPSKDGGFDFFGSFKLPEPLPYEIQFLGEVKKFSPNTRVDPKSVSRLVARLSRKQYGIFVTTSYFTNQAQQEVLKDAYPVHLMSGIDLANMILRLKITDPSGRRISGDWLSVVLDG